MPALPGWGKTFIGEQVKMAFGLVHDRNCFLWLTLGVKTRETHEWRKTMNTKKPLSSQ